MRAWLTLEQSCALVLAPPFPGLVLEVLLLAGFEALLRRDQLHHGKAAG